MAFTLLQSGAKLYGVDQRGSKVELTLPTGVTVDATLRARFAILGNYVIVVNAPSRPLAVDANLNVRVLCPNPPVAKPTASGVNAGGLSGAFKIRQTYIVKDAFGNVIAESDFSDSSDVVTIASKLLRASKLNISPDAVSGSRLYRTTDGTDVFFQWLDLDGNTQTSIEDDLSDAGLSTFAAPSLGTPPDMSLIAEFKSRLFGVPKSDINRIFYSEVGLSYAWPSDNVLQAPRTGSDNRGVTGFVRRRDALGIGRANLLAQLTGTSDTDFRIVIVSENAGIEAPDSVVVYRDIAFFLWKDGIYQWDASGLKNVCEGKVSRWFTRNGTFNLSRLKYAFAHVDPLRKKYRLFLASAGSSVEDCWIEYDFQTGKFWGPHTSHAFNPSSAFMFATDSGLSIPMVGGRDGFVRLDRAKRKDDDATGIDFDVVTARHDMLMPADEKYFGELTVLTKPQTAAAGQVPGALDVYTTVGDVDEKRKAKGDHLNEQPPFEADLTEGQNRLGRIGIGKACKLRFRNNQADVDVNLRGYEITPVNVVGRRR